MKKITLCILLLFSLFGCAKDSSYRKTYNKCLDKAISTLDMRKCISAEYDYQDKRLNKNYQSLMKRISPSQKKELRDAQRKWITYRDKSCSLQKDGRGGTMDVITSAMCYLEITKKRADFLESSQGIH